MTSPDVDVTAPRCGTCCGIAHPTQENEGYSSCCNDRIEYPDEYLQKSHFRAELFGEPMPDYDEEI